MAGKTRRPALVISAEERERLERLRDSRKAPNGSRTRGDPAALRRGRGSGGNPTGVGGEPADYLQMHRQGAGGRGGSGPERPLPPPQGAGDYAAGESVGAEYRMHQATDHGLAAELWTLSALARYTREHAPAAGHVSLAKAARPRSGASCTPVRSGRIRWSTTWSAATRSLKRKCARC